VMTSFQKLIERTDAFVLVVNVVTSSNSGRDSIYVCISNVGIEWNR